MPLTTLLKEGRELKVRFCACGKCGNGGFFVPEDKRLPDYCPFCGLRFMINGGSVEVIN